MKKLLFLITLILLFSCEKEPECWTCKIDTIKTYINVISDNTTSVTLCDKTVDEIFAFETENTENYTEKMMTNTGAYITVNVKKTAHCKK